MKRNIDYTLYLVTDREFMSSEKLEDAVEEAILGGCTLIQLREKKCSTLEFYEIAKKIKELTDRYRIPLIINDRIDIALAVDAAGVHIGQEDLPVKVARKLIGENKILGVSTSNLEESMKAYNDGADYLGVGAMFPTNTKEDASVVSIENLLEIRKQVPIPIVVIGGINKNTIRHFKGIDIDGFAVVSAIIAKPDIKSAAVDFINEIKKLK
ncbi:MAG: thiamine phosphate synthase [Clostridiales bacterium]|uniref:thiamine phosphate synthase n=1 Tax=Clostridium sp. N3C TaxID=1776758 RepID=UPI00092DF0B4|nr:thiamine phosphate synthase [Clostridium sp. N3C]NLZ49765.1 thiamine phosphate synthase [Clostridiales bacterium]SCN24033.1 Thiamine-phosphate synthase [Clostridium sp. N3C]